MDLLYLARDITAYDPNVCVLLGDTPLRAALGPKQKITDWRGSLFISTTEGPFHGRKCIASLHPAYVLREFSGYPLLKFNLKRARDEGSDPRLILPEREIITNMDASAMAYILDNWPAGCRCALDIEGSLKEGWPCVSVCGRPTKSFCIVWNRFSEEDHARVLGSFARLMYRTDVPKVLQNQLYDNFVMSYGHGILIRNVTEDTMIKGFAVYAELPRSLSTQASVWTRQPHWKDDSMYGEVGEGLYRGCAMDSAITLEICNAQDNVLTGGPLNHYRKIIELQNIFLYMELRGIRYDQANVNKLLAENTAKIKPIGDRLVAEAGSELRGPKGCLSAKRFIEALYVTKGYPPQYSKDRGRKTTKLTSDVEAILNPKTHAPK